MTDKDKQRFTTEETTLRFEAALRGAREVGHKQMKDIGPKREMVQHTRQKKTRHAKETPPEEN
jgi:hypothetical protein